jgi:dTDP-4-dehydrorhamnose 3,5-epimerase
VAVLDPVKFVIIGAKGQLGTALKKKYPQATAVDSDELDITNADEVARYDWSNVSVILNAAAYTNVDGAETLGGRAIAWRVNAVGVANLTKAAMTHNLTLVHVSSEYVFDGTVSPHGEDEPLTPLGVYAQSKAAGDVAALLHDKTYILRTSWVIGDGQNFVRTMIGLAGRDISPTVVGDQIGRLTFTSTLVDAVAHLLTTLPASGIYNISNDGDPASWADITRAIFSELDRSDLTVTDTTTDDYFKTKPEAAPRPLQSVMDLSKIKASGLDLRSWRDDLSKYVKYEVEKEKIS